jgi:Protein of unknown function (DUF4230)
MAKIEINNRGGGGFFGKLIILCIALPIAIITLMFLFSSNSPFGNKFSSPPPVILNQITREYKIITAQQTSTTNVEGESKSALPFSSEKYTYQMVMTVTAGIDLTKMRDSDIRPDGETVYVRLPEPEILTKEKDGYVIARSQELLSFISSNKNIVDEMQRVGQDKIMKAINEDGRLMREARLSAEIQIRNFILQLGYYKTVKFEYQPTTSPTAPPVTSKPS